MEDSKHAEYAIKFFVDIDSFLTEATLYAACFPDIRHGISSELAQRAQHLGPLSQVAARFLPQVEAVCDGSAGGLEDPRGRPLPPCIVMEKGESLHDWGDRAEPDLFTSLAVRRPPNKPVSAVSWCSSNSKQSKAVPAASVQCVNLG